jgi:YHS domain-containing protein
MTPRGEPLIKKDTATDPVCGRMLTAEQVKHRYTWRRETYSFDSDWCFKQFIQDPESYHETEDRDD